MTKGTVEAELPQPEVLKTLDQTKRDLLAALKQAAAELVKLDPPLEKELLESLCADPELFFSPRMVRANRCFIKGQVPRERVIREFGEEALVFFKDMTTDPKLNPRPKPEEIVLAFRSDFEALFQQQAALSPDQRIALGGSLPADPAEQEPPRTRPGRRRAPSSGSPFLSNCFTITSTRTRKRRT